MKEQVRDLSMMGGPAVGIAGNSRHNFFLKEKSENRRQEGTMVDVLLQNCYYRYQHSEHHA